MATNLGKTEYQRAFVRTYDNDPYVYRQLPSLVATDGTIDFKGVAKWGYQLNNFTTTTPGFPNNQLPTNKKDAKPPSTACENVRAAHRALSARDMPSSHRRTPITQTNLLIAGMKFNSNPTSDYDKNSYSSIKD